MSDGGPAALETPGAGEPAPEPRYRLAPRARWAWRISAALATAPVLVAAVALPRLVDPLAELGRPLSLGAPAAALALVAVVAVAVPELRWRRWRYEVGQHEIDIRHGSLSVRRTLVPLSRVQHVETSRGPLQRMLDLATVVVHTAAGPNEIPQLRDAEARVVRDRVAALTRMPDDV